ncbi:MAG: ABC transporter substrate-binding protein [Alphaproteobacteria bacterium]|nr:MAG: ABC transporter substrate-binding protein [Alphaproteobacteria bacterium]
MALSITIAVTNYDRTRALIDGRAAIEGCRATVLELEPEEMFHRALHYQEFDVAELSFSNFVSLTAEGNCPYLGIPVFPGRKFRHSGIFINTRSGIEKPQDLKGKIVGTPEYQVTAVTWVRGILEDEYGLKPTDMRWRWGGLQQAGRAQKTEFVPPEGLSLEPIPEGATLQEMLAAGEIDALVSPRSPACFDAGHADIRRLFPDYVEQEKAYFKRTGIFPIMHLVGIRKALVEANPWLPDSVFKAFEEAKALAMIEVAYNNIPRVTNPWMEAHTADARAVMGDDFWPYGFAANRGCIEAFLRYHYHQGLAARELSPQDLFVPSTLARSKI